MTSRTQLIRAVRELRSDEVRKAAQAEPSLAAYRDERGRSLLHICCSVDIADKKLSASGSVRMAQALLDAGLDVNEAAFREGSWKATPLWYAIARGRNLKLARFLLERGSDPNHCLWAAAHREDVAAIEMLLEYGADIDPIAEDETPFLCAVKQSHFKSARVLLAHGANVNFQDSRGMSALHYMLKKGSDSRHFEMLLGYGARGDLRNSKGHTAFEIMSRKRDPAFRRMGESLTAGPGARA
jgi:ankyrin repeat protein